MTKPRIEEIDSIFEPIEDDVCEDCKINLSVTKIQLTNLFEQALTQLRQDTLDEAVEVIESLRLGKFDVHPKIQGFTNVGNYNQALDDTTKALQDKK